MTRPWCRSADLKAATSTGFVLLSPVFMPGIAGQASCLALAAVIPAAVSPPAWAAMRACASLDGRGDGGVYRGPVGVQRTQVLGEGCLGRAPGLRRGAGQHPGNVGLYLLGIRGGPGHHGGDDMDQSEAVERLRHLVVLQVVDLLVIGGRAVSSSLRGDADALADLGAVAEVPGLDVAQGYERLADAAAAGLDIGVHLRQEAAHVGGALGRGRPVYQRDCHRAYQEQHARQQQPARRPAHRPAARPCVHARAVA